MCENPEVRKLVDLVSSRLLADVCKGMASAIAAAKDRQPEKAKTTCQAMMDTFSQAAEEIERLAARIADLEALIRDGYECGYCAEEAIAAQAGEPSPGEPPPP